MDAKNTKALWKKYSSIFSGRYLSIQESLIPFGFECGDGWYKIIDELCETLCRLIDGTDIEIIATQVKEKFGGLRFYYYTEDATNEMSKKIMDIVDHAEDLSYKTCEQCGKPGKVIGEGWLVTLCKECEKKR